MTDSVTGDFIFGTLATDDLRLAAIRLAAQGLTHANAIDPVDPGPMEPVQLSVTAGLDIDAERIVALYTLDGSQPGPASSAVEFEREEILWDTLGWGYQQRWVGGLPGQPEGTLIRYRIGAEQRDGSWRWSDPDPDSGASPTYAIHVDRERAPAWVKEAVIYHVFVDRFRPGGGRDWNAARTLNDFWGGTLRGVIEGIPYIRDLGATCLWLSPVYPSPTHHGYDATDYFGIEPRLGTDADLVELFDVAHQHGLKVILDFVANHLSDQHPAFRSALASPKAPERCWFSVGPDGRYRSFFGVESMPQINGDDPAARDYLIDAATHWLKAGADGFRLDYANGPSHAFWSQFRAATRRAKPDSFTVGEVVETAELQRSYQGRLDGTLDFLLLQQIRAFLGFETVTARDFHRFLERHFSYFPEDFVLPSFLDNHDMNRFLWVVGGDVDRLKLAALLQFTLPHPPIIYYGTEVGLSQRHDLEYPDGSRRMEESRTPMPWGSEQDAALRQFYADLIRIRRTHPGLWRGKRRTLAVSDDLYVATIDQGASTATVAVNRGRRELEIPVSPSLEPALSSAPLRADGARWILPGNAGAIFLA